MQLQTCVCVLRSRSLIHTHTATCATLSSSFSIHLSFSRCCCLFFFVNNNENTLKHARTQRESANEHTHTFITQRACTRVLWHFASVFVYVYVYVCLLTFHYFAVVVDGCCWREKENLKGKKAFTLRANTLAALRFQIAQKFENYRKCN